MSETTGRDWYPVIFLELERIGATEAGIGVRELPDDDEPGIWIEFFTPEGDGVAPVHSYVCNIEDAPMFLDAISAGEASTPGEFGECFSNYFEDDEDAGDDDDEEE